MGSIDKLAERELEKHKLPTLFSYRQAFIIGFEIGYRVHKVRVFGKLYGSKVNLEKL